MRCKSVGGREEAIEVCVAVERDARGARVPGFERVGAREDAPKRLPGGRSGRERLRLEISGAQNARAETVAAAAMGGITVGTRREGTDGAAEA